jgi:ATP-dependent Clp protease adaptor protein ClpS
MMSSSVNTRKSQFGRSARKANNSGSFFLIPPVAFSVADWFTQYADEPFDWHHPCNSSMNSDDLVIHSGQSTDQGNNDDGHEEHHESDVATATPELARPPLYVVVLFNDDYTPMEFVILVLQQYFGLDLDRATEVMLSVHYEGKGVAGVYPRDIAETKAQLVNRHARAEGHPLLCQIEPQSI